MSKGLIDGLGDFVGLGATARAKLNESVKPDSDSGVQSIAPKNKSLHEEYRCVSVARLSEDFESPYAQSYSRLEFSEKMRKAIALMKEAIIDESYKGVGDDGKVMRKINYQTDISPYAAIDKMLTKEIYVDRFKPLITGARAILDEYME